MIIDFVKHKKNLISVSSSTSLSSDLQNRNYAVRDNVRWELELGSEEAWIKVNTVEPADLFEVDFTTNGTYDEVHLEYSLDNKNWVEIPPTAEGFTGYSDIEYIFLRLRFVGVKPGFSLTSLQIFGDERYQITDRVLSLVSKRFFPQSFFEQFPTLPDFVTKYLEMLENPKDSVKKFFDENISVSVYLIFEEGEEGSGAINSFAINTTPINSGSATTFSGFNTALINRVAGGGVFYDIAGNLRINLLFNSIVEGISEDEIDQATYYWDFDDPYSSNNIVSTTEWGKENHLFTKLGVYDVRFVVNKSGQVFEASVRVEIAPSPYVISGPREPDDGDLYTIFGLTSWPDGFYDPPYVTLSDGETIVPSSDVELINNNDRTFTIRIHNIPDNYGYIKIFDKYYGETRELEILFNAILLDSNGDPILDSNGNYIFLS